MEALEKLKNDSQIKGWRWTVADSSTRVVPQIVIFEGYVQSAYPDVDPQSDNDGAPRFYFDTVETDGSGFILSTNPDSDGDVQTLALYPVGRRYVSTDLREYLDSLTLLTPEQVKERYP